MTAEWLQKRTGWPHEYVGGLVFFVLMLLIMAALVGIGGGPA